MRLVKYRKSSVIDRSTDINNNVSTEVKEKISDSMTNTFFYSLYSR